MPTTSATPCTSWSCLRPLKSVRSLQAGPCAMWPPPLLKEPPEPMVNWVLAPHRPAVGWPRRRSSQGPGVSYFELQSSNSHLEHAVLVLHGIGRREGVLGQAGPMGQPGCLSLVRLQLARVPDHTVPSPATSPLCRDLLCSSAHSAPILP